MRSFIFIFLLTIAFNSMAQAPDGINYQAVIRNLNGTLVTGSNIAMRIQVKQGTANGTIV
jgi:hypothetical protein